MKSNTDKNKYPLMEPTNEIRFDTVLPERLNDISNEIMSQAIKKGDMGLKKIDDDVYLINERGKPIKITYDKYLAMQYGEGVDDPDLRKLLTLYASLRRAQDTYGEIISDTSAMYLSKLLEKRKQTSISIDDNDGRLVGRSIVLHLPSTGLVYRQ